MEQSENGSVETQRTVEHAVQLLWEKAREASVVISTLREEKKKLLYQIEELENELKLAREEVTQKKVELSDLKKMLGQQADSILLSEDEKVEVQMQIKNLISKINSYL